MNKKKSNVIGIFIAIILPVITWLIFHFLLYIPKSKNIKIDNFNVLEEIPLQLTVEEEEKINREIAKKTEEQMKQIEKDYNEINMAIKKQAEIYNKNFLESAKKMEQQLNEFDNMVEKADKQAISASKLTEELQKKEKTSIVLEEIKQIKMIDNLLKQTDKEIVRQENIIKNIEKNNQDTYISNLQKEAKVYQKGIEMEEKQNKIEELQEINRYKAEELLIKEETERKEKQIKELTNIVNKLNDKKNDTTDIIKIDKIIATNQLSQLLNN